MPGARLRSIAVVVALAAAAVGGCGSHAPTKQDVIARGNAICEDAARAVLSVAPAFSANGLAASYYAKVIPIAQAEAAKLLALPRPAQDRALLERFLAAVARAVPAERALAAAAIRGDQATVARLAAQGRRSDAAALAARYGMRGCSTAAVRSVVR